MARGRGGRPRPRQQPPHGVDGRALTPPPSPAPPSCGHGRGESGSRGGGTTRRGWGQPTAAALPHHPPSSPHPRRRTARDGWRRATPRPPTCRPPHPRPRPLLPSRRRTTAAGRRVRRRQPQRRGGSRLEKTNTANKKKAQSAGHGVGANSQRLGRGGRDVVERERLVALRSRAWHARGEEWAALVRARAGDGGAAAGGHPPAPGSRRRPTRPPR